jgi:hypothetical protein
MLGNNADRPAHLLECGMASNLPVTSDTITQQRLKAAMLTWLDSFRFQMAVTLSWNRSVGMDRARDDLKDLLHRVDRTLLKSHFNKLPSNERTVALFAFEGMDRDHVHVHSLWRAPRADWWSLLKLFRYRRGGVWNEVVETGSCDIEACNLIGGNSEILGYTLKEQHRFSEPHLLVWADEFHRAR